MRLKRTRYENSRSLKKNMKKLSQNKKRLARIIITTVLFVGLLLIEHFVNPVWYFKLAMYAAVYLFISYDVLLRAVKNIAHGDIFDENFLMCIASIGAFVTSEYSEALAVMLFYQAGELFQSYAVGKSRKNVSELMDMCPESAVVLRDGVLSEVYPDEIEIGETIVVKPGEKIAIDGIIEKGSCSLNMMALTGESLPVDVQEGDVVLSGSINTNGVIHIKTQKQFADSTVSKILDMVENASSKKAKAENFITKFARWYTPMVCLTAVVCGIIASLVTKNVSSSIYNALSFLVISCPCALVISVPMGFFGGIGSASRNGILVKGGNYLELLSDADIFVFDKTGTLTKGNFSVTNIIPFDCDKNKLLKLAAAAESGSNHPIAKCICEACGDYEQDFCITEIAGKGVKAEKNGDVIIVGNAAMLEEFGIYVDKINETGSIEYVVLNKKCMGAIVVADTLKDDTVTAIEQLKKTGSKCIMLTGDNVTNANKIARDCNIDEYKGGLLPADKVAEVEKILNSKNPKEVVCFVGDGINDAPVIMRADVGVAMGALGSDSAIEAADVVLMKDNLTSLVKAKKIAKKTVRVVKQNIVFALFAKLVVFILCAFGVLGSYAMWFAVFADVGVSVLAIINSMRCLSYKE